GLCLPGFQQSPAPRGLREGHAGHLPRLHPHGPGPPRGRGIRRHGLTCARRKSAPIAVLKSLPTPAPAPSAAPARKPAGATKPPPSTSACPTTISTTTTSSNASSATANPAAPACNGFGGLSA